MTLFCSTLFLSIHGFFVADQIFPDEVFKEKLGAISIKTLTRIAKDRRAGAMGFAEAMVLEYNGKKKFSPYRLSINKLYMKDYFSNDFNEIDDNETYMPDDAKVIENELLEDETMVEDEVIEE